MEGHVGSIDTLENIVGFEFYICDEDDALPQSVCGQVRTWRDMSDQLTCWKTLLVLNFIFVMKMMPPATKRVCVGRLGGGGTCRIN